MFPKGDSMTDTRSRFDSATKVREIAAERERFMATTLGFVMVKSAPWSGRASEFGSVDVHNLRGGTVRVERHDGTVEEFPDLDAMLEVWIGD